MHHYRRIFRGNGRGRPRMVVEIAAVGRPRKLLWQLPRNSAECRGDCRLAVALAADGRGISTAVSYCRGNCRGRPWVVMVGTTEFATDKTAARAVANNRSFCRGSAMSPWNLRISTVARSNTHGSPRKFRGHCRGPSPKSQIMCIRGTRARGATATT